MAAGRSKKEREMVEKPAKPHYHGHRARLRQRFLTGGPGALQDYELLELLLTFAIPYSDVKLLAKRVIEHFGSFTQVLDASPDALMAVSYTHLRAHETDSYLVC